MDSFTSIYSPIHLHLMQKFTLIKVVSEAVTYTASGLMALSASFDA